MKNEKDFNLKMKLVKWAVVGIMTLIMMVVFNPLGYNYLGYRQVVESPLGTKRVVYGNGYYWKFPGSTTTTYPNLVTVAYTNEKTEATVNQPMMEIRFLDATTATAEVFVKYALPNAENLMLKCHEDLSLIHI